MLKDKNSINEIKWNNHEPSDLASEMDEIDYGFFKAIMDEDTKQGEMKSNSKEIRKYIENRLSEKLDIKKENITNDRIRHRFRKKFVKDKKDNLIKTNKPDKINKPIKIQIAKGYTKYIEEVLNIYEERYLKQNLNREKIKEMEERINNQKELLIGISEYLKQKEDFEPEKYLE